MKRQILLLVAAINLISARSWCQLAITEVMSNASTNLGATYVVQNADYWELTNFGTNDVSLDGYKWNDNAGGVVGADPTPFTNLTIRASESILFAQFTDETTTNEAQFAQWWGTNLPVGTRIVFYQENGLSSGGDSVRLWGPSAINDSDLAASADFGASPKGFAFSYDALTGVFGIVSSNGVGNASKAVTTDDVGSPGVTTGSVPLRLSEQPASLTVDPGQSATFRVAATGLPYPRYQWLFEGNPIDGALSSEFVIASAQFTNAGSYQVRVENGLETVTSSNAVLTVNGAPLPPSLIRGSTNQTITVGQRAVFSVVAGGNPTPTYQWYYNNMEIAGETSSTLTILNAIVEQSGDYAVRISNVHGVITNSATLLVVPKPKLVITEVMSSSSTNGTATGHQDWWELTNLDTNAVSLLGYRFDDSSPAFANAYVITNAITIKPQESIVFVESMTGEAFLRWWGPENLAPDLQVVSYSRSGLGLSSLGDELNLWNATADDVSDTIAADSFSTATPGVSFNYDYDPATQTGVFGQLSVLGQDGVFRSVESDDIGSPGYIQTPPFRIRFLSIQALPGIARLTWESQPSQTYILQSKTSLSDASWAPVSTNQASGTTLTFDDTVGTVAQKFYRVITGP